MRRIGRAAFAREEMVRLGFWPPNSDVAAKEATTVARLHDLYAELGRAQDDVRTIAAQISEVQNIDKLIAEIRRRRIERVRAQREEKKKKREAEQVERRQKDAERRRTALPFLGVGVSSGLQYEGGDSARVASLGLPTLATATDIAGAIGIVEPDLAYLTYHRTASKIDHYHRFTIPKKRGGERVISSPKKRLRAAQGWLLESILSRLPVHDAAVAFRPGLSIADNAKRHQGQSLIIRIDLKDFFPSVELNRVKRLFQSLGYNEGVSTILGLIATETTRVPVVFDGERKFVAIGKRSLPQGACTSPSIANLVCVRMDTRLAGAAAKFDFRYTRYADDLIFSHDSVDAPAGMLLGLVRAIIAGTGFTINEEKTAVIRPHQRQTVTGLVVNGDIAPRLSRRDLRKFRAFLHQCNVHGTAEMSKRIGQDAVAYAGGYLSFIHMVSPDIAQRIVEANPWVVKKSG
jgi:retron-type reverse transcriptase